MSGPGPQTKTKSVTRTENTKQISLRAFTPQEIESIKKQLLQDKKENKTKTSVGKQFPKGDLKESTNNKKRTEPIRKPNSKPAASKLTGKVTTNVNFRTTNRKSNQSLGNPLPTTTASWVHPQKTGDIAESIQARLKKKSPWYDSIMRPISGGGVKIPDPVGTNTGTYQHVQNISVPVNPQGIAGLRVVSPYINSFNKGTTNGSNYQITSGVSTNANLAWGSGDGSTTGNMAAFTVIPALMKANALSHRVVSGCVTAQAETSTLNDAGEMVAFVTPFRCQNAGVNTNFYNQQWDSSILPVNAHKPLITRHYPISSDWNPFDGEVTIGENEETTVSYQDFIDPNHGSEEQDRGVVPWEFGIVCSGMAPSSGIVRFQVVTNYEFVPISSTAMVTQDNSPIDPAEENFVLARVAADPMTGVVSQKQASSAPSDSSIPKEETGFGMFADIIKEIVPLAISLI